MEWTDILNTVLGTGAAAASGGIFGLLGSTIGAWMKMRQAKQEHLFEKDRWAYETDLQKLNIQARAEENEQAIALASSQGSWAALQSSVSRERKAGESYKWVNAVKDLYRPILTTGLLVMTWFIYDTTTDIELKTYIVYSVVFTACTAATWWYADRALAPPGMKNR